LVVDNPKSTRVEEPTLLCNQVSVERHGEGKDGSISISTAYDTNMNVFGYRWTIHFTAASPGS
jgi:hypothetical protein